MTNRVCSALSALFVAMASVPVHADDPSLDVIAAWGGPVNAAHVENGLAYIGSGRRLVVLDVRNINNFIELAALDLGSTVQDLAVRDGYAFVAAGNGPNGFCVVDVSTPARPALVWSSTGIQFFASHAARQVQLHGDYAYVRTNGPMGVLDIADPSSPAFQGTILDPVGEINDFAIVGDRMYLGSDADVPGFDTNSPLLAIYDLAADAVAPLNPSFVGSLVLFDPAEPAGELDHLAVAGDYVYTLSEYGSQDYVRLNVVDVSNPRAPTLTSSTIEFPNPYFPTDIAAASGRLYIANSPINFPTPEDWTNFPGLLIYDIAKPGGTPDAPTFIKSWKTHGAIYGVHAIGNIAWLFDAGEGLIALDVTNPLNPARKDNYHSPAYLTKMDKVGDKLYVSDLWNGFTILDVVNPAAPQVLGVYQTPLTLPDFGKGDPINKGIYNWGIEIRDNRAYLAAGYGGIHVVNVANPATPSKIGGSTPAFPQEVRAAAIELDGDFAHVGISLGTGGLYTNYNIIDVSQPIVLPAVGSVEIGKDPNTIATRLGYSYLAMGNGLTVINTTTPAAPFVISAEPEPFAQDLAIADDMLDVVGGNDIVGFEEGLHLFGLAQRDAPDFQGFYPANDACAVAVQNQRAYVIGFPGGLIVLDIADPRQPQPIAAAPSISAEQSAAIFVDEPSVYVTLAFYSPHVAQGLVILKLEGCLDSAGDADLNCDGIVNGFDLAMILSQWTGSAFYSPCLPSLPADLSHDCRINGADLAILLAAWG